MNYKNRPVLAVVLSISPSWAAQGLVTERTIERAHSCFALSRSR